MKNSHILILNDTRIRFTKLAKKFQRGANIHKCNKRLFYVQTHYFFYTIDVTTALRAAHVSRAVAKAWNGTEAQRTVFFPDTIDALIR
jgi:hypothetical protein